MREISVVAFLMCICGMAINRKDIKLLIYYGFLTIINTIFLVML